MNKERYFFRGQSSISRNFEHHHVLSRFYEYNKQLFIV